MADRPGVVVDIPSALLLVLSGDCHGDAVSHLTEAPEGKWLAGGREGMYAEL